MGLINWLCHNSWHLKYRQPFGAVSVGQKVELSLAVRCDYAELIRTAYIRLWSEPDGEIQLPLTVIAAQADWLYFQGTVSAEQPGVIWYYFIVTLTSGETVFYGNNPSGLGGEGAATVEPPPAYQLTVSQTTAVVGRWWLQASVYQIFPDRFARADVATSFKPGSLLHTAWDDDPVYVRDETGRILAYDFFGGNLAGVEQALPYLTDLGIGAIYFNPIFDAVSNHKYDTADYKQIDPGFGTNDDFLKLCQAAAQQGINIILDGVFSHTGSDSRYFNRYGRYAELGAFQSSQSIYSPWYRFREHPYNYECWWDIDTMPNVNELEESYQQFIITGSDSVLRQWLGCGIKGWRLDVADELPDQFIKLFCRVLKQLDPEAVLLGEVWEDASHKVSYGQLRQYLWGDELDATMNYPFRQIVLDFLLYQDHAERTQQRLMNIYENYPRPHFYAALNLLGSHDVPRILTVLGEATPPANLSGTAKRAQYRLPLAQRNLAVSRLKLAALWQFTFPGVPAIYYGDEAGLEGYADPLNRRTYPWGHENHELLTWFRQLARLRRQYPVLQTGHWQWLPVTEDVYAYTQTIDQGYDALGQPAPDNMAVILLNRSPNPCVVTFSAVEPTLTDLLNGGQELTPVNSEYKVSLAAQEGKLLLPQPEVQQRGSGVLLHPSSLNSPYGIGDLGPSAYQFIDWLAAARQSYWQILPLCDPGAGYSPYQAKSAFAGNPLLISPESLAAAGLLTPTELATAHIPNTSKVPFALVAKHKERLFRLAFSRFNPDEAYWQFCRHQQWLDDYVLFTVLSTRYGDDWSDWPTSFSRRNKEQLSQFSQAAQAELDYQRFLQYQFHQQWQQVRYYAHQCGLKIIGDVPLFIAHHSADVWANQDLFLLTDSGRPAAVAGVPPDDFSATGQIWGNTLYNWPQHQQDGYQWWLKRLAHQFSQADILRLDHFRGLAGYWQIPTTAVTAAEGCWQQGPGADFLLSCYRKFPKARFIAEDLGVISDDVTELRWRFELPGMTVLQFDLLAPCRNNSRQNVIYSGTHDNNTIVGWLRQLRSEQAHNYQQLLAKLNCSASDTEQTISSAILRLALAQPAATAILPLQDILALDAAARMNTPGTPDDNWHWRLLPNDLPPQLAAKLAQWTIESKRC